MAESVLQQAAKRAKVALENTPCMTPSGYIPCVEREGKRRCMRCRALYELEKVGV